MRPGDPFGGTGELLQADVMRFMAIIAFCLIAILALVRNADPAPVREAEEPLTRPMPPKPMPAPKPAASPVQAEEPAPTPATPPPAATAAPAAAPPEEASLSLRFASDRDFLRLVSSGGVRLFALEGERVLAVDPQLRAAPATLPGPVHELLPETVPELLTRAIDSGPAQARRWAVALPARTAGQIRHYVQQGATGVLVIDRFGEVRHVP